MPSLTLLVLCLSVLVCVGANAIDYDSMTWASWTQAYDAAVANDSLAPVYANSPRVRAKILAANAITLQQLRDGEDIFRQRVSDVAGVESFDRVALEFIQTDAHYENDTAAFAISVGISALPLPSSFDRQSDNDSSSVFAAAVDQERMRIIGALRSGAVEKLHLFGSTMRLLDLALDGETFYPIDLKPWVDVHLVLASSSASTALDDPFTNLKTRLSIARLLRAASVDSSDILLRPLQGQRTIACGDVPIDVPFSAYSMDVALVAAEVHVESAHLFPVIIRRLLNATSGLDAGTTFSLALADAVSSVDPQLALIAVDVDSATPASSPASSSAQQVSSTSEGCIVSFTVSDFPIKSLEQRKWQVLDGMLSLVDPFSVSNLVVSFDSVSILTPSAKEDAIVLSSDWNEPVRVLEGSDLSPINTNRYHLLLKVNTMDGETLDWVKLREFVVENVSSSDSELRDLLLGGTSTTSTSSIVLDNIYEASTMATDMPETFVDFSLTLVLAKDFEVNVTCTERRAARDVFQLYAVRSALVLLLQQIGIVDSDLLLLSNLSASLPVGSVPPTWVQATKLEFRVGILDESQRQGVRRIVLSRRLVTTIATYSRGSLALVAQSVNIRADNSLARPKYLPGSLLSFPSASAASNSIERVSVPLTEAAPLSYFVYQFHVPDSTSSSPVSSVQCNWASTTLHKTKVCFSIRIRSDLSSKRLFLREISSVSHLTGASLVLPTPTRVTPTNWSLAVAAATAINSSISGLAQWIVPAASDGLVTWTFATELDSSFAGDAAWSLQMAFSYMEGPDPDNRVATNAFSLIMSINGTTGDMVMHKVNELNVESHKPADPSETKLPPHILVSSSLPNITMLRTGSATSAGAIVTSGVKVAIDLSINTSVSWGMYSTPDSVSSSCSECLTNTAAVAACANSPGACASMTTCFQSLADSNLLAAASTLSSASAIDFSWALDQCLSPSDDTLWPETLMPVLNNTYRCLWTRQCPLEMATMSTKRAALYHEPATQLVQSLGGDVTLLFTLDVDGGEFEGGETRTFTFSGSLSPSNIDDAQQQLGDALTDLYRSFSTIALVEVVATTNATEGVELSLQYSFLGRLTIPFLSVLNSSNPITVSVKQSSETLTLESID